MINAEVNKVEHLVIDRQRWLRGDVDSYLLRPYDDKMCCLGFYCKALGLDNDDIYDIATPEDLDDYPKLGWLLSENHGATADCNEAMNINDNFAIPEPEREQQIAEIFLRHGIVVEFVG